MGRILAIDYGQKRTGLAVTDMLRITANPLLTIETKQLEDWLSGYFVKDEVDCVVIGLPTQMNGEECDSMRYIKPFMERFHKKWPNMPLIAFDERFTSTLAHRAMIDGGMKRKARQNKYIVDKLAATIILEDFLSSRNLQV